MMTPAASIGGRPARVALKVKVLRVHRTRLSRYFVPGLSSVFISAATIWSMLKLADRWLGG
jgi:predicted small integral membrane protein